jgi:hypothetical protein
MRFDQCVRLSIRVAAAHAILVATAGFSRAQPAELQVHQFAMIQLPAGAIAGPDEEVDAEENQNAQPVQAVFRLNDDQFDQWVFGGPRNSEIGRNKLDSKLTLQVDDVARACNLSRSQEKKLLLAGRGDIKRFFDKVDEKRKKFDKFKHDQTKVGEIYQELQPLQVALNAGLFGDGSLFSKTLKTALDEDQAGKYEEVLRERKLFRYQAKVELIVSILDQSLGLSDLQRRKLVDLILKDTKPPKIFGQYDYYLVMYQTGRISESKLKLILDEHQWASLVRQLNQMRGMEQFLRNNGALPEPEVPAFVADFILALQNPPSKVVPTRVIELPAEVFAGPPEVKTVTREIERVDNQRRKEPRR